jgi:hypothetical protein
MGGNAGKSSIYICPHYLIIEPSHGRIGHSVAPKAACVTSLDVTKIDFNSIYKLSPERIGAIASGLGSYHVTRMRGGDDASIRAKVSESLSVARRLSDKGRMGESFLKDVAIELSKELPFTVREIFGKSAPDLIAHKEVQKSLVQAMIRSDPLKALEHGVGTGTADFGDTSAAVNRSLERDRSDPYPRAKRAEAVSIKPFPWSLVTKPTWRPCPSSQRAKRQMSVVLPAPRNPPISTKRRSLSPGTHETRTHLHQRPHPPLLRQTQRRRRRRGFQHDHLFWVGRCRQARRMLPHGIH